MDRILRVSPDDGPAWEWDLVLEARGIPSRVEPVFRRVAAAVVADGLEEGVAAPEPVLEPAGWGVVVPEAAARLASRELEDYDRERAQVRGPAARPDYGPSVLGPVVALLLAGFFAITGARSADVVWFAKGSAMADKVLGGELWRAVTALTLHADIGHIFGNAVGLAVLLPPLGRRLGPGLAAWAALATGVLGNLFTALVHGRLHDSVGASTTVFGVLGLLGGIELLAGGRASRHRAWVVLAASLALFGMMGTGGERTDIFAHLFGLGSGVGLGAALGAVVREAPRRTWRQPLAALAALGFIALAWARALT